MDMAKNKILLKNAFIHPITQIPFHGDLLIENGKIIREQFNFQIFQQKSLIVPINIFYQGLSMFTLT